MKSKKILIAGASIAGNTAAWWLSRQGYDVTIVEKEAVFREGGQNVDVRGAGREVLRKMGLEQQALDLNTSERGTDWVDEDNKVIARFAVDDIGDGPTAEMEIMRGDLSRIIYEPASMHANFRFGDSISAVEQDDTGAMVTFGSGAKERYELIIVAEGVGSSTRELLFPGENRVRYMNLTMAYFSVPGKSTDGEFARVYNTVGGRGASLKPGRDGNLRVYIGVHKEAEDETKWAVDRQKRFFLEKFANDKWEFPRILEGMMQTDNFYFDVLRQVRLKFWSKGRVILTGDSAWCATPLSGVGTTLAVVGGYVLAGELAKTDDYAKAFAEYERIMRPFVKEGQSFPKIGVRLLWPHTSFGVKFLRGAMRLAGKPSIRKIFSNLFVRDSEKVALPDYQMNV